MLMGEDYQERMEGVPKVVTDKHILYIQKDEFDSHGGVLWEVHSRESNNRLKMLGSGSCSTFDIALQVACDVHDICLKPVEQERKGRRGVHLTFNLKWYDFWVGVYWDSKIRTLYFCPLPMLVFSFSGRQEGA